MGDYTQATEAWNMGTETLKRLARCLDLCSFFSQQKDIPNWYNVSMDWRRNISPFLTKEEFDKIDNKLKSFPPMVQGKVLAKDFITSYKILDDFYILCVGYMKAKGLLMPQSKDPKLAVLNN